MKTIYTHFETVIITAYIAKQEIALLTKAANITKEKSSP